MSHLFTEPLLTIVQTFNFVADKLASCRSPSRFTEFCQVNQSCFAFSTDGLIYNVGIPFTLVGVINTRSMSFWFLRVQPKPRVYCVSFICWSSYRISSLQILDFFGPPCPVHVFEYTGFDFSWSCQCSDVDCIVPTTTVEITFDSSLFHTCDFNISKL